MALQPLLGFHRRFYRHLRRIYSAAHANADCCEPRDLVARESVTQYRTGVDIQPRDNTVYVQRRLFCWRPIIRSTDARTFHADMGMVSTAGIDVMAAVFIGERGIGNSGGINRCDRRAGTVARAGDTAVAGARQK